MNKPALIQERIDLINKQLSDIHFYSGPIVDPTEVHRLEAERDALLWVLSL